MGCAVRQCTVDGTDRARGVPAAAKLPMAPRACSSTLGASGKRLRTDTSACAQWRCWAMAARPASARPRGRRAATAADARTHARTAGGEVDKRAESMLHGARRARRRHQRHQLSHDRTLSRRNVVPRCRARARPQ
jgi:hypothetical protein